MVSATLLVDQQVDDQMEQGIIRWYYKGSLTLAYSSMISDRAKGLLLQNPGSICYQRSRGRYGMVWIGTAVYYHGIDCRFPCWG